MEIYNDWYRLKENATLSRARYRAEDINRNLIPDINVGDTVIRENTPDDIGIRNKANKFKVVGFYPHHVLLRAKKGGYLTSVGYLEMQQRFFKKGAKSKYALEEL